MSFEKKQLIELYEERIRQKEVIDKDIERIKNILYTLDSYDVVEKKDRV